jgi:hypothetical protein
VHCIVDRIPQCTDIVRPQIFLPMADVATLYDQQPPRPSAIDLASPAVIGSRPDARLPDNPAG